MFIKYCVFCHLSLASTRLLLVVQKIPANRSDCTLVLRWKALKVFYSDVREEGVAVNCEKTQFFLNTLYMLSPLFKVPFCTCENLKNEKSFLIYHCIGCPCTLSTRRLGFSIYFAFSNQLPVSKASTENFIVYIETVKRLGHECKFNSNLDI